MIDMHYFYWPEEGRILILSDFTLETANDVSHLYMRWDSPSRLSLSCCAVWLTVRWSPPDGDAVLSHAAGPFATSGCEILLHPESHDKPEV